MKKKIFLAVSLLGISFYGCEKDCELIPKSGYNIVGSDENCYYLPNGSGNITGTFTDARDNTVYDWVQIGNQVWMAENLRYLPSVVGSDSSSTTKPYYYVYSYNGTNVDSAKATYNYNTYGVLYNFPAAITSNTGMSPYRERGVCPDGWFLPDKWDVERLVNYFYGREYVAGDKLKEAGTAHWNSPNAGAINSKGFTALPGGTYNPNHHFYSIGYCGVWWTASSAEGSEIEYSDFIWSWVMNNGYSQLDFMGTYDDSSPQLTSFRDFGFSVRCVKE